MKNIWDGEDFEELLNGPDCFISNPGPLHAPIKSFSIRRNPDHQIILTTVSEVATSDALRLASSNPGAGAVYEARDTVVIDGRFGTATLEGVVPFKYSSTSNFVQQTTRHEQISLMHAIDSPPDNLAKVGFLLEWISNFEIYGPLPHRCDTKETSVVTLTFEGGDGPIKLESEVQLGGGYRCFRIILGGFEIFFGGLINREERSSKKEGFILYRGNAPEELRRKVRDCLSFVIGRPIVYLGYRLLSKDSRPLGFRAIAGHNDDYAKYAYVGLPPTPLFTGQYIVVDEKVTSRLLEALFDKYEDLDFLHVSWIYWHGLCSAIHSQPVQIGAAIEALQKAYRKLNPNAYQTQIVPSEHQKALQDNFTAIVDAMEIGENEKAELKRKTSTLNNPSQKILNERFFAALDLRMGPEELQAWKRRNDAAHGTSTEDYRGLIKDVKLLMNIFCRIVLRLSGGGDRYIDFHTNGFPVRPLSDPVSSAQHQGLTQPN